MDSAEIKELVRSRYGSIAAASASCCAPATTSCCSPEHAKSARMGYTEDELQAVPEGANLGLGCGNPQAIAALQPGEVLIDLGSGAGFDCLLAARQVGPEGRVMGVDMTHDTLIFVHRWVCQNSDFAMAWSSAFLSPRTPAT
jgi:hypothetical protein